jgi:hypothetical protein
MQTSHSDPNPPRDDGPACDDPLVDVAARFRAARLLADVSLVDAAAQLGVSVSTLRRAEQGGRPIPPPWIAWAKARWIPPDGMKHPLEDDG